MTLTEMLTQHHGSYFARKRRFPPTNFNHCMHCGPLVNTPTTPTTAVTTAVTTTAVTITTTTTTTTIIPATPVLK